MTAQKKAYSEMIKLPMIKTDTEILHNNLSIHFAQYF